MKLTCFSPLKAYKGPSGIVFDSKKGYSDMPIQLRCGQCIGCRLTKQREWSIRAMHEAQMVSETVDPDTKKHGVNCFLTLTYDDEHLPEDRSLKLDHWQKFAKRVRRHHGPFRFLHCGEYGPKTLRPHYHALIFGLDFTAGSATAPGNRTKRLWVSPDVTKLWPYGFHTIGPVNYTTARYVAAYTVKKALGKSKDSAFERVDPSTGECWDVLPEYATMSRRPGLGTSWFEKYHADVYPSNFIISDGKKAPPPSFYDQLLKKKDPSLHEKILHKRKQHLQDNASEHTQTRLDVRSEVTTARTLQNSNRTL